MSAAGFALDQCGCRRFGPFGSMSEWQLRTGTREQAMASGTALGAKRPVIAVVDDDPAVCGSLKFSLELEGFSVRIFRNAGDALGAADLDACDCFVIDQRMPQMSGMELIDTLRRRHILTPAILIVSHPSDAVSVRAAKVAIPVVEKPLLSNALLERIREACRQG
jgi:FixJ family two-component response regulator